LPFRLAAQLRFQPMNRFGGDRGALGVANQASHALRRRRPRVNRQRGGNREGPRLLKVKPFDLVVP